MTATVTWFPFSKHTGRGGPTPTFSSWRVYLQFTWEVSLPPFPVELSRSWLLGLCRHSCLLCPACLFTVPWGIVPAPLFGTQVAPPSLLCIFFCFCLLFSLVFFLFFSLGWGQSVQGAVLIWPRVVSGSTACCLAHLVVCFSWASKSWHLAVRESSWFLHLTWSGDAMHGLGVWRCRSFASSWWFFLQSVSPASLQYFTLGSMSSASSL
jgi:hypothetical protein